MKTRQIFLNVLFFNLFLVHFCLCSEPAFKFPAQLKDKRGKFKWAFQIPKNDTCIPVKQCPTYSWMLEHNNIENEIFHIGPDRSTKVLKRKRCFIEEAYLDSKIDSDTIIACPKLDLEDDLITKIDQDYVGKDYDENPFYYYDPDYADYSDYVIDIDTRRENFKSFECFKNVGTRLFNKSKNKRCVLDVTHGPKRRPLMKLETKRFSGRLEGYSVLKNLLDRKVFYIKSSPGVVQFQLPTGLLFPGALSRNIFFINSFQGQVTGSILPFPGYCYCYCYRFSSCHIAALLNVSDANPVRHLPLWRPITFYNQGNQRLNLDLVTSTWPISRAQGLTFDLCAAAFRHRGFISQVSWTWAMC